MRMWGRELVITQKYARRCASKNGKGRKPGHLWSGENFRVPTVLGDAPPSDSMASLTFQFQTEIHERSSENVIRK